MSDVALASAMRNERLPNAASSRRPMVSVEGLTKIFPVQRTWAQLVRQPFHRERVTVVKDVSLHIEEGEFFGLLGPNGAGKSTLFKMLATLILPDEGEAVIDGKSVTTEADAVRRVLTPVIPDERSLYWRLSARENVRLFAVLHGLRGAELQRRVDAVLENVGLADTAEKMVGQFSSGMKQRLLIARSLLAEPRVLLLDEPTRSLDPLSARDFRRFLREELADRQGVTVLLATHLAEEALDLCDRLAVLDRGKLIAVGTVPELRARAGDDRFELRARGSTLVPASLNGRGGAHDVEWLGSDDEGWSRIRLRLPDGDASAAALLADLVHDGVQVSRLEPVALTLADLLERIVAGGRPHA
ncbi:MAG: ABC transporter ATP-binding protein [Gemmatimonadota bacterium]